MSQLIYLDQRKSLHGKLNLLRLLPHLLLYLRPHPRTSDKDSLLKLPMYPHPMVDKHHSNTFILTLNYLCIMMICFDMGICAEPSSVFWYTGVPKSHDGMNQYNNCIDNSWSRVSGPAKCQATSNSSSLTDVSLKLFRDLNEQTKMNSWSNLAQTKPEEPKKTEFRLFGIDLKANLNSNLNSNMAPANTTEESSPMKITITDSVGDSMQHSVLTKEHKQSLMESPKEIQSKQICSTRNRIKVSETKLSYY